MLLRSVIWDFVQISMNTHILYGLPAYALAPSPSPFKELPGRPCSSEPSLCLFTFNEMLVAIYEVCTSLYYFTHTIKI